MYRIAITSSARDQLARLQPKFRRQIGRKIDTLGAEPRASARKLKGRWAEFWRLRSGDFRVVFTVDDEAKEVLITWIGNRSEVPYD